MESTPYLPGWQVTIVLARAVHVHVALGHVVERAGAGHAAAVRSCTNFAARPVLGCGELVIGWVGIALALLTGLLVYEGLEPAMMGEETEVPPTPDQVLGVPVQAVPPLAVSDQQTT